MPWVYRVAVFLYVSLAILFLVQIFLPPAASLNLNLDASDAATYFLLFVLELAPMVAFRPWTRIAPRNRLLAGASILWGSSRLVWSIVEHLPSVFAAPNPR
jgi:hypothetical protein